MEVVRIIEKKIKEKLFKGKTIILLGSRQTGKTTLLKKIASQTEDSLWLNADEQDVQAIFEHPSSNRLSTIFANKKLVVIDEAQRIPDIGIKLKLITDQIPSVQLIFTGSSAFELANHVNEPLTGRKWEYKLYPLSFGEMVNYHGLIEEKRLLPHRLIYGYYPEIVSSPGDEKAILQQLTDSFLYKDILMWQGIKRPDKLLKLLQALAYQLGNEVSYLELSEMIKVDKETVENYLNLLEQTFVIFRLNSYSRNLRSELKKSKKIYFYDNGVRNALLANFQLPELRTDIGALWENFIISERIKFMKYNDIWSNVYFWRTTNQQEIDFVEERDGKMYAYECKWNPRKMNAKVPSAFSENYDVGDFKVITPTNYDEWIL
jgi:predicted AAA+ superfamily ATPase